jgi:hypothetical protein
MRSWLYILVLMTLYPPLAWAEPLQGQPRDTGVGVGPARGMGDQARDAHCGAWTSLTRQPEEAAAATSPALEPASVVMRKQGDAVTKH